MRHLDDFDLRPGDPGNPRRPAPTPPRDAAQRSSLAGGDPDAASGGGLGPAGVHDTDLRRYTSGAPAFDAEPHEKEEREIDRGSTAAPSARSTASRTGRQSVPSGSGASQRGVAIAVVLVVALALVAAFWLMSRRVDPAPDAPSNEANAPAPPEAAEDAPKAAQLESPLPPLGESDALVRQLVGALSSNPALARWLSNADLIRTFTASVENASLGNTPSTHLPFLRPRDPYRALERTGANGRELVPDPTSYRRYDLVASVFTSIDPQATAEVYRRLHGLIQEAYAELGYPDESFDSALASAFETLLATPVPATAPTLERHLDAYRYADPALESLQPIQKQLLRMGPDHAREIQEQIRRLASAMKLPAD